MLSLIVHLETMDYLLIANMYTKLPANGRCIAKIQKAKKGDSHVTFGSW